MENGTNIIQFYPDITILFLKDFLKELPLKPSPYITKMLKKLLKILKKNILNTFSIEENS